MVQVEVQHYQEYVIFTQLVPIATFTLSLAQKEALDGIGIRRLRQHWRADQEGEPRYGRSNTEAADSALTTILGNVQMEYVSKSVNCDNYNWFVRAFNKPHHEIENDPLVWSQVAALVDASVFWK